MTSYETRRAQQRERELFMYLAQYSREQRLEQDLKLSSLEHAVFALDLKKMQDITAQGTDMRLLADLVDSTSCLHRAVVNDQPDVLKFLLRHGATINNVNWKGGQTPLHLAVAAPALHFPEEEIIIGSPRFKMLLHNWHRSFLLVRVLMAWDANVFVTDARGETPMDIARSSPCPWLRSKMTWYAAKSPWGALYRTFWKWRVHRDQGFEGDA